MQILEREPLLASLTECLGAVHQGSGRLVLLTGEAGIGKTALADAFVAGLPRGTRVLRGRCDPVVPARPFAPIGDMARASGDALQIALEAGDRDRVLERFLRMLRELGTGAVIVFEDLHWVDSATLDLLGVVGRRLPETPVLIVGTYRANEVDAEHPLRVVLGDIPVRALTELQIPPLSVLAVQALAVGTGIDAADLHATTGGNPFFVTEIIASGGTRLPPTVRDAFSARVARLSPAGRAAIEACAVLGVEVEAPLITAVAADRSIGEGLRECLRRQLLVERDGKTSFRHELARQAALDRIPPSRRADLNRRALAALRRGVVAADDVRLTQHAIEAGDVEAIATLAPRAAEQAAGLGAHGEAADFLAIVLALPAVGDDRSRAELLDRYAYECSVSGRVAAARTAEEHALELWRRLGDRLREGDAMRALATYMWHGGEGDAARELARSAIDVLEPIKPAGQELAHAYAKFAQLLLNSNQDDEAARAWAERALAVAERIGDEQLAVHAATTLNLADVFMEDPENGINPGLTGLEATLVRARAAGLVEDIARILINLVETARDLHRYELTGRYIEDASAFLRDRQFDLYRDLLASRRAQFQFQRGQWKEAERSATDLLEGGTRSSQTRSRALGVLGLLRARRGEADVWSALDEALQVAGPGEHQETCPLHAARAEAAWLEGDVERAGDEAMTGLMQVVGHGPAHWYSDVSFWAWRTGRQDDVPQNSFAPYVLHAAGRHREAADAWLAAGLPYEAGLALSDSADEVHLREALGLFLDLGARVMAGRVAQGLKSRGASHVTRGPRPSTRANPAGLTSRQLEILRLIETGARNQEIAERLVLSPKTVDHHVSAIFRKLGVDNRGAARRMARQFGLQDGGAPSPS